MLSNLRSKLTYANAMATIAVFVALGGTSVAALSLQRNSVKGKHIATNAVTSPKVKNFSLLAQDFRAGQLPAGPQGATGPKGDTGPRGDTGAAGANGATNLTARSATSEIPVTCEDAVPDTRICGGTGFPRADCAAGERATGGGHGPPITGTKGGFDTIATQRPEGEERPDPVSGTPTGWAIEVDVVAAHHSSPHPADPASVESPVVYVVCASP